MRSFGRNKSSGLKNHLKLSSNPTLASKVLLFSVFWSPVFGLNFLPLCQIIDWRWQADLQPDAFIRACLHNWISMHKKVFKRQICVCRKAEREWRRGKTQFIWSNRKSNLGWKIKGIGSDKSHPSISSNWLLRASKLNFIFFFLFWLRWSGQCDQTLWKKNPPIV